MFWYRLLMSNTSSYSTTLSRAVVDVAVDSEELLGSSNRWMQWNSLLCPPLPMYQSSASTARFSYVYSSDFISPHKFNIKTPTLKTLPTIFRLYTKKSPHRLHTPQPIFKVYALTGREFNLLHAGSVRAPELPAKHRPPDIDTSPTQACYNISTNIVPSKRHVFSTLTSS